MVYRHGINDMPKGWRLENKQNEMIYNRWRSILQRVYDEDWIKRNPCYINCTICERWLLLSNFIEDFFKIDGYDEEKFLNGELEIDKDIKSNGKNKEYSLENCTLVSKYENLKQMHKTRDNSYLQKENHPMYGKERPEMKKRMSGKNNPNYGNHNWKNNPNSKKVAQYDLNENLIKIYNSIREAQRETGISRYSILKCCKGEKNNIDGFIYKYIEEENKNE